MFKDIHLPLTFNLCLKRLPRAVRIVAFRLVSSMVPAGGFRSYRCFAMLAAAGHMSLRSIAAELTARGIHSRRGVAWGAELEAFAADRQLKLLRSGMIPRLSDGDKAQGEKH
jgi:hypothetical protein